MRGILLFAALFCKLSLRKLGKTLREADP